MTAIEHDAAAPGTLTRAEDELGKIRSHESAAHEKRNWVRLSYDCNKHCVFCLDSMAHNGTMGLPVPCLTGSLLGQSW